MPDPAALVRSRRNRRLDQRRAREGRWRMGGVGAGLIISLSLALLIVLAALAYAGLTSDLPSVEILPILLNPPDGVLLQPTQVYDRSGEHLLLTFAPRDGPRRYLLLNPQSPQHLPDSLAKATVAAADPNFWSHDGYVLQGWTEPEKHPTIAQRLVAELLLYNEAPSVRRAIRERMLAAQITVRYGRSQILEWYLNSADFGKEAFGAEAAAQLYLGKSASELTLAESALLAASAQAPGLNPFDGGELALQHGDKIIQLMKALKFISSEEAEKALAEPGDQEKIASRKASATLTAGPEGMAPAFLHLVLSQLDQQFARERIERGGVRIMTTLDYDLQQQASCATLAYAARLAGEAEPTAPCPAANRLPPLPAEASIAEPSLSALIFDPTSGQVLAAVGETHTGAQTALMAGHDPGSLLTPIVYLTAFTRGLSPASLMWDIPPADEPLSPGALYHGPVRMRIALVNDYAVPAETIAAQMGAEAVGRTESSFGLSPGSSTLLDMASAYGVFATEGARYGQTGSTGTTTSRNTLPTTVLRVEGLDHSIWLDLSAPQAQPVVEPPLAYLINNILSDDNARQVSLGHPNPFEIGRPVAVKIGQTQSGAEAWAVGYTPERLAVTWMGTTATAATQSTRLSPRSAAGLWSALIQLATQTLPPDGWSAPPGVTTMEVCDPSGMLPTKDCPSIVSEVFLKGNEPVQGDTLYRSFAVNRETGFLATVFTPPDLIEERVYMVVPPEAQAWAKSASIPVAPSAYDAIQAAPINPDARIAAPAMFAEVSGQVQIRGTASGADFEHYRVLVGQGLDPHEWVQVGSDATVRIEDGVLATWDTAGLSGLYAVQLQVIRSDQRVDTAVTQVTVSNK